MNRETESHSNSESARIAALEEQVTLLRTEVENLRESRGIRFGAQLAAHPLFVLAVSLGAALAFAALVILNRELAKGSDRHTFYLIYMVPIAAPFAAFLLDRARRWLLAPLAVDLPVVVLSFARALYDLPLISGHALFLTYALLTTHSRVAQVLAVLVLAEVIYFKIFIWQDSTLYGGMIFGTLAAALFHLLNRKNLSLKLTP